MTDHIDELAELYALGSLSELERARVERHAAQCSQCAGDLRRAQETVAALAQAQAQPLHEAPSSLQRRLDRSLVKSPRRRGLTWHPFAAAVAAAIVLAFIPTWVAVDRNSALIAMRQDERALARLASAGTQISHAQFMSPKNRPMNAKVLYGPHGDWYYVVVMHPRPGMQVAYVHDGRMEMLGTVATHGESGTLYLPVNHKMDELALLEGSTVVADAHLVY
ncbi:MAG TPA: zf-HC2 domain-containing protein [Candidatus Baltobacteraceae bacterium]|nr:zf-HC2 domain-containing protein [Candidatus Baltobacteraceae bacterium]